MIGVTLDSRQKLVQQGRRGFKPATGNHRASSASKAKKIIEFQRANIMKRGEFQSPNGGREVSEETAAAAKSLMGSRDGSRPGPQ